MVIVENVTELKTKLHSLLNMVSAGEELLLKKDHVPFAKIIPYDRLNQPWEPGGLPMSFNYVDVDEETQKEIEEMFYGDE